MTSGPAEVFDLGYRGYEGERTSRWSRRRAIWLDGIRISLGLGRGVGAKVAPWLLLGLALVPMVVLLVIAAFVDTSTADPDDFELPSYAEYFEWAIVPLGLFAAVVAPLLLCPDRRDGVLALYAARPDHAARLRRRALGRLPDGGAWRRLAARGAAVRVECARRVRSGLVRSPTSGTSCRGSSPRASSWRRS